MPSPCRSGTRCRMGGRSKHQEPARAQLYELVEWVATHHEGLLGREVHLGRSVAEIVIDLLERPLASDASPSEQSQRDREKVLIALADAASGGSIERIVDAYLAARRACGLRDVSDKVAVDHLGYSQGDQH